MARDLAIEHIGGGVYDLVEQGGDLVTLSGPDETLNHLTYRLQTWLGESPYARTAGIPYIDGVFGQHGPVQGIAALFTLQILETDGIEGMLPLTEIDIDDEGVLRLRPEVFLQGEANPVALPVEVFP